MGNYTLNGDQLLLDSESNLTIYKNQTDTIIIEDWNSGDFGITLEQQRIETPETKLDDCWCDNGRRSWNALNWDGSINMSKMALDFDMPEIEVMKMPDLNLGIDMIDTQINMDISQNTDFSNNLVQDIVQGIIDTLKDTVMSIITSSVFSIIISFFIPFYGPSIAAEQFANMINTIKSV